MLDSVLEMVAPQMIEKKLDLAPYLPATNLFVVADDDKMRQILLNLFANALKFTPAGGVISVLIDPRESQVAIGVGDTGIGIPGDQLEKIFEPFVQAKSALKPGDQGVGLGLAISRQLARAMNGDLTVVSETGKGSIFTLTLPRRNK
ncbi:MAG: ATP-binding protein [Gemmatimonadota bacterium]|nr:ATP-binding protein [Gemmatimonadota bacterium]